MNAQGGNNFQTAKKRKFQANSKNVLDIQTFLYKVKFIM
jgi:hypothetical protein